MRPAAYLFAYLLVLVAVAVAFGSGTIRLTEDSFETSIQWGDRVLESPEEFSSWLAARGVDYDEWARKHPKAAARMELRAHPMHVVLWPPAIHGRAPTAPRAFATYVGDTLAHGAGAALAAALAALLLAGALAVRGRVAAAAVLLAPLLAGWARRARASAAKGGAEAWRIGRPRARSAAARSAVALRRAGPRLAGFAAGARRGASSLGGAVSSGVASARRPRPRAGVVPKPPS